MYGPRSGYKVCSVTNELTSYVSNACSQVVLLRFTSAHYIATAKDFDKKLKMKRNGRPVYCIMDKDEREESCGRRGQ